jgi:chromatin segregation and condensation protein Rec8/ScpA/Scc1 (kleisin family)
VGRFLERFRAVLRRRSRFDLDAELEGLSRAEQAIAFLAVLELRKGGEVTLEQSAPFAPIRVLRAAQESTPAKEKTTAWTARSA